MSVCVVANGKAVNLLEGSTLHDLVQFLEVERRTVAVECNGRPISRREMGSVILEEGDQVELVCAAAGG